MGSWNGERPLEILARRYQQPIELMGSLGGRSNSSAVVVAAAAAVARMGGGEAKPERIFAVVVEATQILLLVVFVVPPLVIVIVATAVHIDTAAAAAAADTIILDSGILLLWLRFGRTAAVGEHPRAAAQKSSHTAAAIASKGRIVRLLGQGPVRVGPRAEPHGRGVADSRK